MHPKQAYAQTSMRILEALASIFINTFGITQPTPAARRQAAWFILGLLIAALVFILIAGTVLYQAIHR
jgi:hypothetical protein